MSGIEVVAVVAAIVSGFGASVTMFQQWKARTAKNREAQESETVLSESGPLVQKEYNDDFKRLGKKFAEGDDIGRAQMQSHLIILQQSIISLLSEAISGRSADQISLAQLMATSKSVRNNSIQTLAEQFQRMATAESLPATNQLAIKSSISAERERRRQQYCKTAIRLQNGGEGPSYMQLTCSDCMWGTVQYPPGELRPDPKAKYVYLKAVKQPFSCSFKENNLLFVSKRWHISHRFFLKCHLAVFHSVHSAETDERGILIQPSFGCILCDRKGKLVNFRTGFALATHVESRHSNAEFDAELDIDEL